MDDSLKLTCLYGKHVALEAKMSPFAGFMMPIQYSGIIAEHEAVRTAVGMFDVSHMGEFLFTGPTALDSLNHILTNDYSAMPAGKVRYGVLCTEDGGCIDDLIVYKFADDEWFVVVNASNRLKDFAHMSENLLAGTHIEDISDTLRLEASMPLYGHEMDETVSPLETGLGFGVRLDKDEFIGRDALIAAGEPTRCRVGLEATGRGILREHQDVYCGGELIGRTTSGTFAPHLKKAIAMALVGVEHAAVGTEVEVDVRGRRIPAVVVPMPFYKHA